MRRVVVDLAVDRIFEVKRELLLFQVACVVSVSFIVEVSLAATSLCDIELIVRRFLCL
jgi:hypothetical protein